MSENRPVNYLARHKRIRDELIKSVEGSERACIDVSRLASQLGMDIRTVRAHLEIMELNYIGVFMDPAKKQFCTKEGIMLLIEALKAGEKDIK